MAWGTAARAATPDDAYLRFTGMLEAGKDTGGDATSLVDFFELPSWGDMILRPRQRLLAKIIDNASLHKPLTEGLCVVPMDAAHAPMGFNADKFAAVMPHCVTVDPESGVLLYDERIDWAMLCSRSNPYAQVFESLDDDSDEPRLIIMVCGRGVGKTTFCGGVAAHQTKRIVGSANPHGMFNLKKLKPLAIQNVANSKRQAGEFFAAYGTFIKTIKWFDGKYKVDPRTKEPGSEVIEFGDTLAATKTSSNSKSGRGFDTVIYIHDEIAFADKTKGPRSDEALFQALYSAVKTRCKGKGLVLMFSSPAEADGVLYAKWSLAEKGLLENALVIQIASWEMIPGETKDTYKADYRTDEDVADAEYGAQFYKGKSRLLPHVQSKFPAMEAAYAQAMGTTLPPHLLRFDRMGEAELAVWSARVKIEKKPWHSQAQFASLVEIQYRENLKRHERNIHVDTSEGSDRLSVVVTHVEHGLVIVDLVRAWNREVGFSTELIPFIETLAEWYDIDEVTWDQFASVQAIQDCNDLGITALKTPFTAPYNDELARNIRQTVLEDRLALYPLPDLLDANGELVNWDRLVDEGDWDDDPTLWPYVSMKILHDEMIMAKKKMVGRKIAAEAPTTGPVTTDDCLDALMGATIRAILKAGGGAAFFTLPRTTGDLVEGDKLPVESKVGTRAVDGGNLQERFCPHCSQIVLVSDAERLAACPACTKPFQVRL